MPCLQKGPRAYSVLRTPARAQELCESDVLPRALRARFITAIFVTPCSQVLQGPLDAKPAKRLTIRPTLTLF